MRIGIDCRFAVDARPRGTGRYIQCLVDHLMKVNSDSEYVLYVHHAHNLDRLPRPPQARVKVIRMQPYPLWEQIFLPARAVADNLDVIHCPGTTGPLFLPRNIGYVVTVHDVSFLLPEQIMQKPVLAYQRVGRFYRRWVVPRVARRATRVVAVSHYACNEIVHMTGINSAKTRVVYHGLTIDTAHSWSRDMPERFASLPKRYMLCLGGDAPHKNVERVVRVFASLVACGGHQGCGLVVLGVQKWRRSAYWRQAVDNGCEELIHFIDFVSDSAELAVLYRRAAFVLSPSLNESFGLPALEAMACGVPVITSNAAAIPEIVGDAALLIDPRSDAAMKQAILEMLNNANLRQHFITRGLERITNFSWQRAAADMLQIYKEAAEG